MPTDLVPQPPEEYSQMEVNNSQIITESLDNKHFLFKGAKIRNTDWVLGLVLYTGSDTKIQQNGSKVRNKMSTLEKKIHKIIIILFLFQLLLALIATIIRMLNKRNKGNFSYVKKNNSFLGHKFFGKYMNNIANKRLDDNNFVVYMKYFILMTKLIPIGFIVNLETIRIVQGILLWQNHQLKDTKRNM